MEASPVKHSNITLWTTVKTDTDVLSPNLKNKTKKTTSVFLWQDFYGKTQHSFQELLKESGAVLLSNPHASYHLVFVCVVIVLCCAVPLDSDPPDVSFESDIYVFMSWKRQLYFLRVSNVPMGE